MSSNGNGATNGSTNQGNSGHGNHKPGQHSSKTPGIPNHQRYDGDQLKRFIEATFDPSIGCIEIRVPDAAFDGNYIIKATVVSRTISGWFDRTDAITSSANALRFVSGYITVNPVSRDLLAKYDNKFGFIRSKEGSNDEDIIILRWLYIDVDCERKEGISSTAEELAAAIALRDRILAAHPDLAASALYGCSGNGGWILVRLPDYPNDAEHRLIVQQALHVLAAQFGRKGEAKTFVDVKTCNPSRIMCLVGTTKCKGSHRDERPWRMVTVDGVGNRLAGSIREQQPLDLAAWIKAQPEAARLDESLKGKPRTQANLNIDFDPSTAQRAVVEQAGHDHILRRAAGHIEQFAGAVSRQGGHDQTYDVACALIKGCNLSITDARPILYAWNTKCQPPWSDAELEHKLSDADTRPDSEPRGYLVAKWAAEDEAKRPVNQGYVYRDSTGTDAAHANGAVVAGTPSVSAGGQATADASANGRPTFALTDLGNAERLIFLYGHKIRWCEPYNSWMIYDGRRWERDETRMIDRMANKVPRQIKSEMPPTENEAVAKAYKQWEHHTQSHNARTALVNSARSFVSVKPSELDRDPWLLNCANGTYDLQARKFRPHSPKDLITKLAPIDFAPDAPATGWRQFVLEIMNGDSDLVDFLQRAVGYAITGVIREHVFFFLYGRGRNGKGTFLKAIVNVLGDYANEIDTELLMAQASPQHPTGMTELEGRRFVSAEETDDNRRFAEAMIKKLTGDNTISARKMYKDFYNFQPTHHIFLAANHKPEIKGIDPAIWRRIKLIPFKRCYDTGIKGGVKPNLNLKNELAQEYSGILNWLIEGCHKWQDNGLAEPQVIENITNDYRSEMDMLGRFVEEQCKTGADERILLGDIYKAYMDWCTSSGVKNPLGNRRFSSLLADKGFPTNKSNSIVYKRGLRLKSPQEREHDILAAHKEMNESIASEKSRAGDLDFGSETNGEHGGQDEDELAATIAIGTASGIANGSANGTYVSEEEASDVPF